MNITLSADKQLIKKTRAYAGRRGTSMNQLIRDFMERVTGEGSAREAATEFESLARGHAGRSSRGYRFDREEAHERR